MEYRDRVYGAVTVDEPMLRELIAAPTIQRLKGVAQAGYPLPWWPSATHSRFEHSLGVMLLLQRYGAPVTEQMAGLLHDASHTAFSHCIDYALDDGSPAQQDHQDNALPQYLAQSEVPVILERHGFKLSDVLDDGRFPLKEQPLPDLCADRLDYGLRDALAHGLAQPPEIAALLEELTVSDGRWAFASYEAARQFVELFLRLNRECYADVHTAVMFITVGGYLRHALTHGYLNRADLYGTDAQVLAKIAAHHDEDATLRKLFARMNREVPFRTGRADGAVRLVCKSRMVDPACVHDGQLRKVSDIDPGWAEVVREESKPKEYFIKFKE